MALRLYVSPTEKVGGYPGLPRQTQLFNSPWGPPRYNGLINTGSGDLGNNYRLIFDAGLTLPVFPFTTVKPTGSPTIISRERAVTFTQGYRNLYCTPVFLAVMGLTTNRTIDPLDFIPNTGGYGGVGQWMTEFWADNYSACPGFPNTYYFTFQPSCAYVWRPSTGSMVGMLWCTYSQEYALTGGATWGHTNVGYKDTAQPPYNYKWPNGHYVYQFGSNEFCRVNTNSPQVQQVKETITQSVAALAGDVMVVEFHFKLFVDPYGTPQAGTIKFKASIGGGTDATPYQGMPMAPPGNVFYTEASPVHNTFLELPTKDSTSFPTEEPQGASGGKLIRVTPRAGKGLTLEFDAATGVTGPTIDAPVDGIGVPSVTQPDSTHIDIDIDIPPTHPLGEAEEATPPSPPKGGGAFLL